MQIFSYMSNSQQPILITTGMHRSGTSLVSSLLQSGGLDIGENLVEGNEGNPKGHFENIEFVNFHESVLSSLGVNKIGWTLQTNLQPSEYYYDQAKKLIESNLSNDKPWGWKEPRTTLFLDFWLELLPCAKFLFVYRPVWEVLDSLYRRGDDIFDHNPEFALQVWMSYNKAIIDFYKQYSQQCLLVNINSVINNPSSLTKMIKDKLSLSLKTPDESLYDRTLLKKQNFYSQRPQIIKRHFPKAFQRYIDLNYIAEYSDPIIEELEQLSSSNGWVLQDWLDVKHLERKLRQEEKNSSEHLERVYQELGKLKGKIGELEYNLDQSQQKSTQLLADLENSQQESNRLNFELENSQQQLEKSEQESEQLRSRLEQSQQESNRLNSELEKSGQESRQLRSQLEHYSQESHQLRSQLATSEQKSEQLRSQLEEYSQQSHQLRSQLEEYSQESHQLRSQLEHYSQESHLFRSQLEEYSQQCHQLRSQLHESKQESHQLRSQIEQLKQESYQLRLELEKHSQESEQLRSQLEKSQQESTQLRSDLEQSEQKIVAMETSKFWKIRKNWFKIKRTLGLANNEK